MLTRTYGNVATPSFPTVALLASVAAYAEATGTGSLRRVSCDDGFQIAFRRSAGGVRWVLATAGREDETRVDAMLMMCERIAEGVCGRDALNCDAGERRGGAQRMKMALGACVAAIDRAMDTRAPPSFAPFGIHGMNRTKTETETERDDDDASARTFVEGLASALPTVDRVAMVATTSGVRRRTSRYSRAPTVGDTRCAARMGSSHTPSSRPCRPVRTPGTCRCTSTTARPRRGC